MQIDILPIKNHLEEYIYIDETYSFDESYLANTEIKQLNDVKIKGYLSNNATDEVEISISVDGIMVLPCSITLKPIEHRFHTEISGNLYELLEEIGEIDKKNQNSIDILPIIWENILVEIPMKVTSKDITNAPTSGEGWKLVTDEEENINPELQKLKDLI